MKKEHLFLHLDAFGCELVREDKNGGYTVWRNIKTRQISGVPKGENLLPNTVCRLCKTLGIESPADLSDHQIIIDEIHDRHKDLPSITDSLSEILKNPH